MAEEEVVEPVAVSPPPADHKRKHEDVEPEAAERTEIEAGSNVDGDEDSKEEGAAEDDSSEAKRPKLDANTDDLVASENGFQAENAEENTGGKEEEDKKPDEQKEAQDGEPPAEEVRESGEVKEIGIKLAESEEQPAKDHDAMDNQEAPVENGSEPYQAEESATEEAKEMKDVALRQEFDEIDSTTRKIEVPGAKVGVLIGKGGDTIRYLQYNSGAKIQILRDAEADPNATTRPVELIGSLASIEKAEKLIHAVIAEADAGGSPSLVARGLPTTHAAGVAEQIEIQIPNDKVGLIIGRGGETIRNMQTRSGARIQLIPQHLPEGDGSKERTVRVSGDKRQIDIASEMIKDVMSQNVRRSPRSSGYNQPMYRSRGPPGSPQWGSRGPHSMPYDYHHRGSYPPQSPHYPPPSYGSYPPHHMGPRNHYGPGWDQRPPSMPGPHPGGPGYDYYGRQGSQGPGPTPLGHGPGPAMGPPPTQPGYNYGQARGPDYGHAAPYPPAGPQQGYGTMYDNPPPGQQPYGGYGVSQPGYPQAGAQPGYPPQAKPSYAMQGVPPHAYGPPRASQPGDMPHQGSVPPPQPYGQTAAPHQQYPYASTAPPQQSYASYGSAAPSDGYIQQPPSTAAPGYQQQPNQPVPSYAQPTGYGQAGPTMGYGSYPASQPGYTEQQAQNAGAYGYQGTQDPNYGQAYSVPPNGQPVYAQTAPAQPGYEQAPAQPAAGYGTTPAPASAAPVGFGKSVSPQPGYPPQYDANQMYAAPH